MGVHSGGETPRKMATRPNFSASAFGETAQLELRLKAAADLVRCFERMKRDRADRTHAKTQGKNDKLEQRARARRRAEALQWGAVQAA